MCVVCGMVRVCVMCVLSVCVCKWCGMCMFIMEWCIVCGVCVYIYVVYVCGMGVCTRVWKVFRTQAWVPQSEYQRCVYWKNG